MIDVVAVGTTIYVFTPIMHIVFILIGGIPGIIGAGDT